MPETRHRGQKIHQEDPFERYISRKISALDSWEMFSSVVVVTDRLSLDQNIKKTISQLSKATGQVMMIGRDEQGHPVADGSKSAQLVNALKQKREIVVVTIQTFLYAWPDIAALTELDGAGFAIIVDEAHSSQEGSSAASLKTAFNAYFSQIEGLERVQWVSSDMYRPFWKSIAKYTPNATWVIDHFHVVKGANEALDSVRRSLQGALDKKGRLELKKGLAYALRKRTRDLNPYEASALRQLREDPECAVLMAAYDLKEDFFDIYDENLASRDDAEDAFDAWCAAIPPDAPFEPFRALAKTVENHREYIFNYWDCPARISNGYTECANRLIKETDMKGRGYSFETLRARTLYRRQNLDRIIASNGLSIGPRIDAPGPLFVTEPDPDGELVDEFIDPRSGATIDATTGEMM